MVGDCWPTYCKYLFGCGDTRWDATGFWCSSLDPGNPGVHYFQSSFCEKTYTVYIYMCVCMYSIYILQSTAWPGPSSMYMYINYIWVPIRVNFYVSIVYITFFWWYICIFISICMCLCMRLCIYMRRCIFIHVINEDLSDPTNKVVGV